MRSIALLMLAAAMTGCVTTRSPSQRVYTYPSSHPEAEVRACIAKQFKPSYYGGVKVQGGWPKAPVSMKIEAATDGARVTTRGPIDQQLASCL